ncbi:MAG: TIGR02281 family clan AA aspartic protease [Hyphomicrobiales bacterium]|nr:TIGR02281 family clan AA aspartic protease [Hyphomicrobiales bacterium]
MIGWAVKQIVMWSAVGTVAVFLFSDRAELAELLDRTSAMTEVDTTKPRSDAGSRTLVLREGAGGHFWVTADVEGTPVRFMVDTGATTVALSEDIARRIGLRLHSRDYTGYSNTAGGVVRNAPVNLREISIGHLTVRNVDAHVIDRVQGMALLGMSFLRRLDGYQVKGKKLELYY